MSLYPHEETPLTVREWCSISDDNWDMLLATFSSATDLPVEDVLSKLRHRGLPAEVTISDLSDFANDYGEVGRIKPLSLIEWESEQADLKAGKILDTYSALWDWYKTTKNSRTMITEFCDAYEGTQRPRDLARHLNLNKGLVIRPSASDLHRLVKDRPELSRLRPLFKMGPKFRQSMLPLKDGEDEKVSSDSDELLVSYRARHQSIQAEATSSATPKMSEHSTHNLENDSIDKDETRDHPGLLSMDYYWDNEDEQPDGDFQVLFCASNESWS